MQLEAGAKPTLILGADMRCQCMVCDLPDGADHGPVKWRVDLFFPGPYPRRGEVTMLLCSHCKVDWTENEWEEPYGNFLVVQVLHV